MSHCQLLALLLITFQSISLSSEPSKDPLRLSTISIAEFLNANISIKKSIAKTFDESMKEHGFFYLDINNISAEINNTLYLLSSMYESSSLFFHNSLEYKVQFSPGESRGASGYQSPNNEIAAFQELNDKNKSEQCKCPDLNENFRWRPSDDLNSNFILPQEFKINDNINILSLYSTFLSDEILPKLHMIASLALNISDINYFEDNVYNMKPWSIAMRINHYYQLLDNKHDHKRDKQCGIRLGAHCDYVGFTLLLTDKISGLQGMDKNGEWYDILSPNDENIFIVNAGEMIERGTNGLWLAAKHRVIQNTNSERISVALFSGPNSNTLIKPFENCAVCNKDPYKYDEIVTVQQHVLNRLNDLKLD